MPKSIISEGKTSIEAIEKGLKELNVSKNQVEIRIIEEKKLRDAAGNETAYEFIYDNKAPEITLKEDATETTHKEKNTEKREVREEDINSSKIAIEDFLNKFLMEISDQITYNVEINENIIHVTIDGENSTKLIGYRGESLNSLQVILSTIANKGKESNIKVILDIGNYKETRKKTLEELAEKVGRNVMKTGKSITLEPMTAYERKIIHTKLQDSEFVKTYSIGEDDKRRVVIAKK